MTKPPRFRTIPGGRAEEPRAPAAKGPKPQQNRRIWHGCGTCKAATGTASRVLIAVIIGPDENEQGRLVAGQKGRACLMCATRGQLTLFS